VTEWKPIRLRRGKRVHVSDAESLRKTACRRSADGAIIAVDEAPNCKACLRAMLDELN